MPAADRTVGTVIASVGHCDDTLHPLVRYMAELGPVVVLDNRGTLDVAALRAAVPPHCSDNLFTYRSAGALGVHRAGRPETIHSIWNWGMDRLNDYGCAWALIVNDDLTIHPHAVTRAIDMVTSPHLGDYDDVALLGLDWEHHPKFNLRPAVGSYREHGIPGFCFLNRLRFGYRYDERFVWWGGDDDLIWTVLKDGRRAMVAEGCWIDHPPNGNTSGRHYPELMAAIAGDRKLLLRKWGKAW